MDRARINWVALKQFYVTNIANHVYSPYHSHIVNFPGKEISKSFALMEKFRKHWNKVI